MSIDNLYPGLEDHKPLRIAVTSSTQISTKVTAVLDHLRNTASEDGDQPEPALVCLQGRPGVSNKLVTIAEIAKREFGGKVYQYTQLTSQKVAARPQKTVNAASAFTTESAETEEVAFETMSTPEKLHDAPALTIYLSTGSIDVLRKQLGEQVSST